MFMPADLYLHFCLIGYPTPTSREFCTLILNGMMHLQSVVAMGARFDPILCFINNASLLFSAHTQS